MVERRIMMPAGSAGIFRFYGDESKGPRISAFAVVLISLLFIIGVVVIKKFFG